MERVSEAESGAGEGAKERELAKAALSVAELGESIPCLWEVTDIRCSATPNNS
jgi:hypothetical protein